jgi:hypothetical protein
MAAAIADHILNPASAPVPHLSFLPYLKTTFPPFAFPNKHNRPTCAAYKNGHCPLGSACPDRHYTPPNERSGIGHLICKHYQRGLCKKGDQCEFAHTFDLRGERECKEFSRFGLCPQGDECTYMNVMKSSALLTIDKAPIFISLLPRLCALLPAHTSPEASVPLVPTAVYDTSSTTPSAVSTSLASVQTDAPAPRTGTMSSLVNTALTPNGSMEKTSRSQSLVVLSLKKSFAESKKNVRKSSLLRRRSVAKDSSEVKVAAVEAGANAGVEEEVAGGDEEADPSSGRLWITTYRPRYFPERPKGTHGQACCQRLHPTESRQRSTALQIGLPSHDRSRSELGSRIPTRPQWSAKLALHARFGVRSKSILTRSRLHTTWETRSKVTMFL